MGENRLPFTNSSWSNYSISPDASAPGQSAWEWCQKCNQLFYSANGATLCPVQGPVGNFNHDGSLSGNYRVQIRRICSRRARLEEVLEVPDPLEFRCGDERMGDIEVPV